jgi:NAD(P)H-hydrate epimerase
MGQSEPAHVLVLSGPGNNGGDALVAASHLAERGWHVEVWTWNRHETRPDLEAQLQELGVKITRFETDDADFTTVLRRSTLVLDGLLGTGLTRDVGGGLARIIREVQAAELPLVAIDLPTGVDSDTGQVRGVALRADLTIALGHLKYGHVIPPGNTYCGRILRGEIGLDAKASSETAKGHLLTNEGVRTLLPAREADANKGDFGKAMIVAGSVNYVGAAALAAWGALRSGTGLVTLGCPADLLGMVAAKVTESTFLPLPSDLGVLAAHAADKLRANLDGYDALLIGCGIGNTRETAAFLRNLLEQPAAGSRTGQRSIGFAVRATAESETDGGGAAALPSLVLDADALNILSEWDNWQNSVPKNSVLTPHPGELARLLDISVAEVQSDRVKVARQAAVDWKQIVVLKGAGTIIAAPDDGIYVSPFSNPALATAGSGDVLAGSIAGLIAQGLKPLDAASTAVYLHGMAGDLLREKYGESGGLAGDLPILLAVARKALLEA